MFFLEENIVYIINFSHEKIYRLFVLFCLFIVLKGTFAYDFRIANVPPEGCSWSKAEWSLGGNSKISDTLKPSKSDNVILYGTVNLDVDTDSVSQGTLLALVGHKLRVLKSMRMDISYSVLSLKNNAAIEVDGIFETYMDYRSSLLGIAINLDDSTLSIASILSVPLSSAAASKDKKKGFAVNMLGKSVFSMGDFYVDSYLTAADSKMSFAFNFANKADKFPVVNVDSGDLSGVRANLKVDNNLPRGKYTFFSSDAGKAKLDGLRISINDQPYAKLGTKIKSAGKTLSIDKRKKGKMAELVLSVN